MMRTKAGLKLVGGTSVIKRLLKRACRLAPQCDGDASVILRKKMSLVQIPSTVLESLQTPISLLAGTAAAGVHSGNPALRRPSISSFEFACPPRAIHPATVNVGSTSSLDFHETIFG